MTKELLLSVREVIDVLNVPRTTLEQWIQQGRLCPTRFGATQCFHPEDIRQIYEEQIESPQRKKRILVVDDDPLVGQSLLKLLGALGFDTTVVSLGLAALDLVSREYYDLVITDIRMPGMDGLEALTAIRTLRRQYGRPPVPEIVITAFEDPKVKEQAEQMGVREFIVKPFDIDELVAALRRNLGLVPSDTYSE